MDNEFDFGDEYSTYDPLLIESKYDNKHNKWIYNNQISTIFFNIKNNPWEISIMWCLIVTTIIMLLSLVVKDSIDEEETLRVL